MLKLRMGKLQGKHIREASTNKFIIGTVNFNNNNSAKIRKHNALNRILKDHNISIL